MSADRSFREKYKRNPGLTMIDPDDVKRFLDLNYIPDEFEESVSYAKSIAGAQGYYAEDAAPGAEFIEEELSEEYLPCEAVSSAPMPEPEYAYGIRKRVTRSDAMPEAAPGSGLGDSLAGGALSEKSSLDEIITGLGRTFQQELLRKIDEKGLSDSEVYKRAELDRRLFSKIRSNENYRPSKATALALAVALELSIDEAVDLIGRAGLAFSQSSISDLIVRYCIENGIYDIYEVNALLYEYDQPLLGS